MSTVGTCEPLCPLRTEAPTFSGKSELLRGAGVTTDAEAKQGSPPCRAGDVAPSLWLLSQLEPCSPVTTHGAQGSSTEKAAL